MFRPAPRPRLGRGPPMADPGPTQPPAAVDRLRPVKPAKAPRPVNKPRNMDEVLADELKVIQDRRVYLKFGIIAGPDPIAPVEAPGPTAAADAKENERNAARERAVTMGLTGLAFSGGGIRSATFALG